jgi:hypothetical protein
MDVFVWQVRVNGTGLTFPTCESLSFLLFFPRV